MEKGKFIVFEGIDGSGKSTQLRLLAEYLKGKGLNVETTCEPTSSPFGKLLRDCLTGKLDSDERAIAALFAADRLDHILNPVTGLKRKLEEGVTVLCDRYYFSSFAYNGGFVPAEWVKKLNEEAMKELRPDLVCFIDVSPEECMRRITTNRGETERYETLEKQIKIRERFFRSFEEFPEENVAVIPSEDSIENIQEKVRELVEKTLFAKGE